jgi:elongation factor P
MPKIAGNEIRPGLLIAHEGGLWLVVKNQAVKPGKGGAYNQVELKNIVTGTKLNQRFRAGETVEETWLEKKDFQFLYASGDALTFMDLEGYDQIELPRDFVGEQLPFLQDGMKVLLQLHEGNPISIALPQQVVLSVAEADHVIRAQTATPAHN